ncbi:hypothetical protein V8G54_010810 [Vigna mungo]|uniref:Uncharacterized protein n=1 Tax=Vigna mungo TaxID=3915 RepID=A0AAQ3P0T6_VIGMU
MIIIIVIPCLVKVHLNYEESKINEKNNFSVRNATVVNFSYNTTAAFTYNLSLFVTIPEKFRSLKYFKSTVSYLNHRFASKPNETLIQGFTGLRMRFNGEYAVFFTEEQLLTLNKNHMAGLYNITIRIWQSNTDSCLSLGLCDIQVPLQSRVFCDWVIKKNCTKAIIITLHFYLIHEIKVRIYLDVLGFF